jgi:hypothetical protein
MPFTFERTPATGFFGAEIADKPERERDNEEEAEGIGADVLPEGCDHTQRPPPKLSRPTVSI